jgi:hypothetical protein
MFGRASCLNKKIFPPCRGSMHAQFTVLPPLSKVSYYFKEATGKPLTTTITWNRWISLTKEMYDEIEEYIRPCHRSILLATRTGEYSTPCALFRQLLRPYKLRIDYRNNVWTLRERKVVETGIRTISGCTIDWG